MVDIRVPIQIIDAVSKLKTIYKENGGPIANAVPDACEFAVKQYPLQPEYTACATGNPGETYSIPFLRYRLTIACLLAENMNSNADLVLASLLGPGLKAQLFYRTDIEPKIGTKAFECVNSILKTIPNTFRDTASASDAIDRLIWGKALDQQYEELRRIVSKKTYSTYYIRKAFDLAKEVHKGIFRQSGEPYLSHPLAVARILALKDAEGELVAAALLHDVIEDADDDPNLIRERIKSISPQIAKYVEAVTSVDREYKAYVKCKQDLGEAYDAKDKEDLDRSTVNKLLSMASEDESMIQAVYIKAADRYHNLLTIDGMPYYKIRKKVEETENYYLPIFNAFGINEFIPLIQDQLWRLKYPDAYHNVASAFGQHISRNSANLIMTRELLSLIIGYRIREKCALLSVPGFDTKIIEEEIYPYEIYSYIESNDSCGFSPPVTKYNVPLLRFSVIESCSRNYNDLMLFASVFIKTLEDNTDDLKHIITGIRSESISKLKPDSRRIRIELENDMATRCVLYLYNQDDYYLYKNGSTEGVATLNRDDDIEMLEEKIKIHKADGSVLELPKGSTALDFAFRIHDDIGIYAMKASINDSEPKESLLFSKLNDNDKVVILHSADREGEYGEPQIKIEWLNHVATNSARKKITKWLQDKYERLGSKTESKI